MSAGEIFYRLRQMVSSRIEQVRLNKGWEPQPRQPVTTRLVIIDSQSADMLPTLGESSAADGLLAGKIALFEYSDLDVGWPIKWHRDPLTGTSSPADRYGKAIDYRDDAQVGDIKVLWELGRQQFLVPMAMAYCSDQDSSKLDVIAGVFNSWLDENPYGYGVHWCSSLEVAIRGLSWSITHQFLLAGGLDKGIFSLAIDQDNLQKHIYQHAAFIRGHLSLYSSANNHLIGELTGLHALCSVFQFGESSDQWKDFAWQSIQIESTRQVYSDGVNKEQAIYYHCWVLEYFLINYLIAGHTDQHIPENYVQQLSRMAQFVNDLSPLDMNPPQIGDADDGVAIQFSARPSSFHRDLIETVNVLAGVIPNESAGIKAFCYHLLHKSGQVDITEPVVNTSYPASYAAGGYAVLGKPEFHVVFDCGALGFPDIAAHGHADMLNVCLAIDGNWWLVDPGTYSYHSDQSWRNYFRGSSGHNVLSINQQDQSEIGGPFMWIRHAEAHYQGVRSHQQVQEVSGWHNGYAKEGAPRVGRSLQVNPETEHLLIFDEIECFSGIEVALHYHFAPDVSCIGHEKSVVLLKKIGTDTRIKLEFPEQFTLTRYHGDINPLMGWYSSSLGKKEPCLTIKATVKITKTTRFTTSMTAIRGIEGKAS
jgi:hypothetical protein